MSRNYYSHLCTPSGRIDAQVTSHRGLTLVEILIAVTLMTFIMLAAIQVLTYVSAEMNRAQNAMVIAGRARTAQLQIERDLACITAPLTPPLRFDDAPGYVQIVEGLGSNYMHPRLFHKGKDGKDKIGWGLEDIAINSETGEYDSTIGDCDDILMFTARAPGDSMFRGLVGGEIMESKEAEICYFLRGTTLYRRVLLIIPDEVLQEKLDHTDYTQGVRPARQGYGFYRDFDVSIRLEKDINSGEWRVKANNLADLTRRENRFGHAFNNQNVDVATNPIPNPFPYSIHTNASWYHLRLPTLAECTTANTNCSWRAGTQIAQRTRHFDLLTNKRRLEYDDKDVLSFYNLWTFGDGVADFPKAAGEPYIDYWNKPLPWNGKQALSTEYQSLTEGTEFYDAPSTSTSTFRIKQQRVNDDVLLNNVIGFDIKVWAQDNRYWDSTLNGGSGDWVYLPPAFIDLGEHRNTVLSTTAAPVNVQDARSISKFLGFQGFYGTTGTNCYANTGSAFRYNPMPCVYDTWTDAFENEYYHPTNPALSPSAVLGPMGPIEGIANLDGITDIMEHVDQWRCPPPYNVPLTGIQIKIRVFDPDTNNIREVTIRKNFN